MAVCCGAGFQGFTSTDELLLKECAVRNWLDGATAVAVWVVGLDTVLVANVGDAKCVLARVSEKVSCVTSMPACLVVPEQGHNSKVEALLSVLILLVLAGRAGLQQQDQLQAKPAGLVCISTLCQ